MPAPEAARYSVGVDLGTSESSVIVEPPLRHDILKKLVVECIITEATVARTVSDERTTRIPFGKFILDDIATAQPTIRLANEIREYLKTT